jgi:hypothetical protein
MGRKFGYVTSLDGGRANERVLPGGGWPIGTDDAALVMDEAGAKCDELAGVVSE